jgi:hypothetical protein
MSRTWIATANAWKSRGSDPQVTPPDPGLYWEDDFSAGILSTNWGKQNSPFAAGNRESQMYRPANIITATATPGGTGQSCQIISKAETQTGLSSAPVEPLTTRSGQGTTADPYVYGVMRATPMTQLPNGIRYWTSGMMDTRGASPARYFPLFSKFEIRAKFPFGQGTLPAFWLRRAAFSDGTNFGASWGEIDIFEHFGSWRHGYTKYSMHFPNTIGVNATQQSKIVENPLPQRASTNWHVYDVEIKPDPTPGNAAHLDPLQCPILFTAHLDGVQYASYRLTDVMSIRDLNMIDRTTGLKRRTDNLAWDICLNNAVGGQWVGQPDQQLGYLPMQHKCSQNQVAPTGGVPSACDMTNLYLVQFPCTFEIDYVRVYDLGY